MSQTVLITARPIESPKGHTLPSGFDKQLRNSLTTLRKYLTEKTAAATKFFDNTSANTRCSRRRENFVSHEAEFFAQRECDLITAPIESPKNPQSFR